MLWLSLIAITFVASYAGFQFGNEPNRGLHSSEAQQQPITIRDKPFQLMKARRSANVSERPPSFSWLRNPIHLPKNVKPTPSVCLHLMKILGVDAKIILASDDKPISALTLLTDNRLAAKYLGERTIVRTQHGARFPNASMYELRTMGDEAHRDHCLACMGELGIPLSQKLMVDGASLSLRDVLRDSTANFHLRQREIAWTALAYALYLSPNEKWENRYGQIYSFDILTSEVIGRSLKDASCSGTHLLTAATAIWQVDRKSMILKPSVRAQLEKHLRRFIRAAIKNQTGDGSWTVHWHYDIESPSKIMEFSAKDSLLSRMVVTGHIMEWITLASPASPLHESTSTRAVNWLDRQLTPLNENVFWAHVCTYTHAISEAYH